MTWEWAAAGIVFLLVVVFSVRLMKRGLFTLEDERALCEERIRLMEEELRQDQKNMASSEHLRSPWRACGTWCVWRGILGDSGLS